MHREEERWEPEGEGQVHRGGKGRRRGSTGEVQRKEGGMDGGMDGWMEGRRGGIMRVAERRVLTTKPRGWIRDPRKHSPEDRGAAGGQQGGGDGLNKTGRKVRGGRRRASERAMQSEARSGGERGGK